MISFKTEKSRHNKKHVKTQECSKAAQSLHVGMSQQGLDTAVGWAPRDAIHISMRAKGHDVKCKYSAPSKWTIWVMSI